MPICECIPLCRPAIPSGSIAERFCVHGGIVLSVCASTHFVHGAITRCMCTACTIRRQAGSDVPLNAAVSVGNPAGLAERFCVHGAIVKSACASTCFVHACMAPSLIACVPYAISAGILGIPVCLCVLLCRLAILPDLLSDPACMTALP